MPWNETSAVDLRREFVTLARCEDVNIRGLCRRFGISAKTGYKLLKRFAQGDIEALTDRSRRPCRVRIKPIWHWSSLYLICAPSALPGEVANWQSD